MDEKTNETQINIELGKSQNNLIIEELYYDSLLT